MDTANTASPFTLNFCAALDDGSLYVAGVADELEDRDVHHTIIWERLDGGWKRYQWKNRSYGLVAYPRDGAGTAVYMGYEGTLKVRNSVLGSSEEIVEGGDDGPSSLRTISSIRVIGDYLYISGMRRMVYRRPLNNVAWSRFDDGLRLERVDLAVGGLYSIDGNDPDKLYAVGMSGEVWQYLQGGWSRIDSSTNLTLLAVRCTAEGRVIVGGEKGSLFVIDRGMRTVVAHSFPDETFTCIERWHDRYFISSDAGVLYELTLNGDPKLTVLSVDGMQWVSWIASTEQRVWFVGGTAIRSLGDDGWREESPPAPLLV